MKFRTTKKAVMNGYSKVISIGYCDLYDLLHMAGDPVAYTCGTYGWNADVYQVDYNTAIVTGYRPFGNRKANYNLNREYEQRGKALQEDWHRPYPERRDEAIRLLKELANQY